MTEETGSRILCSPVSGQDLFIAKKGQVMWSIVRRLILVAHIVAPIGAAHAEESLPRVLQEPLLGLQYDQFRIQFEPLPPELLSPCPTLVDRESIRSNWFIYAKAEDFARAIFYVVGGYSVRTNPRPPDFPKFELDATGVIISIKGGQCTVFEEAALKMFEPHLSGEIPDDVLLALARDHANRTVAAFGSRAKLRENARKQQIAIDKLPPALREAYSTILK